MSPSPVFRGPARLDHGALAQLGRERLDRRFRSLPEALVGRTAAAAVGTRLFGRDGFLGPIVALDGPALEHNLTTMAAWCADAGVLLAPHGKTTMAPALFARQLDLGAWAITAATAAQARIYREFGVSRVVVANELVDPAGLAWLAAELSDPDFEFLCWVDSVRGVDLMAKGLAGAPRPVDVLVEIGAPGARTGVRDLADALAVAEAAAACPALRLVGVAGYEGPVGRGVEPPDVAGVAAYLDTVRTAAVSLRAWFAPGPVVVTAGGSEFFDIVADVLTTPWPDGMAVLPVVRSGAYVAHDEGFYQRRSPLGRRGRQEATAPLRSVLRAWAQVLSTPEPGLALLGAGKRDLPYDIDLPVPRLRRTEQGVAPLAGATVTALADHHAFVTVTDPVQVGDWIGLGLSHPCTTFDKWPLLPVTGADGETVVEVIRTFF